MIIRQHSRTIGFIILFLVGILIAYDLGKRNTPREVILVRERNAPVSASRDTLKVATNQSELGGAKLYVDGIDCNALKSGTCCQGAIRNLTGHEYHSLKLTVKFTSPQGHTAHFVYDLDVLSPQQTFEFNKNLTYEEAKKFGLQFADTGYETPTLPYTPRGLDESEFKDGNMELTASTLSPK